MFMFKTRYILSVALVSTALLLQACGNEGSGNQAPEIKPAPKLSNDATTYAHEAWTFMNEVDPLVYNKQIDQIEKRVRQPARKLSTDWRINVKMTDSVTEGKYALCRKALTSLEIWARTTTLRGWILNLRHVLTNNSLSGLQGGRKVIVCKDCGHKWCICVL